ncbi:capsule assembly Wzi family protein [Thermaurantiacus tibetensis]|uniref:capsule assembly Wzi family protein n=1 Tax=Thermaurantiacus tibetensis TaxID=2759035 RepID=UPI00188F7B20|nr:capsule assembly Wzi family protein [Thermaurantiacus tibetensis]
MRPALVLMALVASPALAGPWAEPGDARLRADIELLRAHRIITGPAESWPLPWAQIERGLLRAEGMALPPNVEAALRRVRLLADWNRRPTRFRAEARVTNEPALVRGFQRTARGDVDLMVGASHDVGRFTFGWGASFIRRGDRPATEVTGGAQLRPITAAVRLGNLALYGGHVETDWGPSEEGGLLFSTSARPFPKVGFRMLEPKQIKLPVLRWLGPVRFEMFGGVLDEERDYRNAVVVAMRFEAEPVPGLTVSFQRAMQQCGKGRPCDLDTFARALLGLGDFDNTGSFDEPGNQIAGFDLAWNFPIGSGGHAGRLFFETVAEDADNIIIEQFARRGGGRIAGPLGRSGASWSAGIEYVDTLASHFFGGTKFPGSLYNHFIYTDGFTYDRRPIGFSLDGDTRMLSFDVAVIDTRNRRFHASLRDANINVSSTPLHRISRTNERFLIGTVGADVPSRFGDLRLELRAQGDRPDTPGRKDPEVQVEAGWMTRF